MRQQKLRTLLFRPGESRKDRLFRWFPWIWLIAAFVITMTVLCLHGRAYIDSDMASEMILADLLNKEGGLLSTNWWYSTELRVFCLQPFYRLGLLLFPQDWYAAQMLGQGLWLLCTLMAYLYMGHGMKLRQCGVWGGAALACPFGVCYLWYALLGGFYLPHMFWILLSLGAMLHLTGRKSGKWKLLHGGILAISSLASGLNGLKGLMGFYAPMLLVAVVVLGLQMHQEPEQVPDAEKKLLLAAVMSAATSGVGYILYSTVLAASHDAISYNNRQWNALDPGALLSKLADFLSLFGYPIDSSVGGEVQLFSLVGILCAVGLVIAAAILFSLVRLLVHWKELSSQQRVAPLLLLVVCLFQGMIFAWTGKFTDTSPYQWLTVVPLVFPVLQLEGETEHFNLPFTRRIAAIAFCVCFVLVSIGSGMRYFTGGYRVNPHLEEVCDWIEEQGYTQGYATFWNGNVVTEWSSGAVEMWVTGDFNTMQPYEWLQKTDHAQPPEGPVFLLTTMEELNSMHLEQLYWWSNVVYEDGEEIADRTKRYIVMEYKDYNDMMAAVQGAQSWETETAEENP